MMDSDKKDMKKMEHGGKKDGMSRVVQGKSSPIKGGIHEVMQRKGNSKDCGYMAKK